MKTRLHLQNDTHMIEWPDSPTGAIQAKAFRKNHSAFKRRRIRSVIQAMPEAIQCGTIYELNCLPYPPHSAGSLSQFQAAARKAFA